MLRQAAVQLRHNTFTRRSRNGPAGPSRGPPLVVASGGQPLSLQRTARRTCTIQACTAGLPVETSAMHAQTMPTPVINNDGEAVSTRNTTVHHSKSRSGVDPVSNWMPPVAQLKHLQHEADTQGYLPLHAWWVVASSYLLVQECWSAAVIVFSVSQQFPQDHVHHTSLRSCR